MVRLRRPRLPHFGHGAFLGAQWTGITIGVGASVPMACISGGEVGKYPHSPGCRPYLSRTKRLAAPTRMVEFSEKSQNKVIATSPDPDGGGSVSGDGVKCSRKPG